MAILKCKMCGGELELQQGTNIAECPYCGTKQTVPFLDDDKKARLYNRANQYRLNSEFDKAYSAYETIIAEKADEAEAYWGLILSEYGVEYVEDPATKKRVPTCHRTRVQSITSNENYKLACKYADTESRMMYEDDAEELDALQKKILNASAKEEPYDVFICYKETDDETGERTEDSVLAQDIYNELTRCGLRVFFSRVSLEDKLGKDYEACIYAALTSSKVMLMVTTDSEHCNAVWVKNEWKRYIDFMQTDSSKMLIPVYKNISPYTLPDEFAKLQAQDMAKLGAIQDLVHGVEKIVGKSGNNQSGLKQHEKDLLNKLEKRQNKSRVYTVSAVILASVFIGMFALAWVLSKFDINLGSKYMFYAPKRLVTSQIIRGKSIDLFWGLGLAYAVGIIYNYLYGLKSKVAHAIYFGMFGVASVAISILHLFRIKATGFTLIIYFIVTLIVLASTILTYLKDKKKLISFVAISVILLIGTMCVRLVEHEKSNGRDTSVDQIIIKNDVEGIQKKIQNANGYFDRLKYQIDYVEKDDVFTVLETKYKNIYVWYKIKTQDGTIGYIAVSSPDEVDFIAAGYENVGQSNGRDTSVDQIQIGENGAYLMSEPSWEAQNKKVVKLWGGEIYTIQQYVKYQGQVGSSMSCLEIVTSQGVKGYLRYDEFNTKWLPKESKVYQKDMQNAQVGDIICLGTYEQDGDTQNGKEDIEWLVLKKEGNKAMVISKYVLDARPMFDTLNLQRDNWEDASLRGWLNSTFIRETFGAQEQKCIQETKVSTLTYDEYDHKAGQGKTNDKVFLLSNAEVDSYFSERIKAQATPYALQKGLTEDGGEVGWWLRTPSNYAEDGCSYLRGSGITPKKTKNYGVRPVMWIDLAM